MNQPYESARMLPGDVLLEMIESKLDESLSTLEADAARRAREELLIVKEYGSWDAFMAAAQKRVADMPEPGAILPTASPSSS